MLWDVGMPGVGQHDGRHIEIMASSLSYARGVQIAPDCTIVSPLTSEGRPHSGGDRKHGVGLKAVERSKHRSYPELVRSNDLRLVVAALETGGRLHPSARKLLRVAANDRVAD